MFLITLSLLIYICHPVKLVVVIGSMELIGTCPPTDGVSSYSRGMC